MIWTFAMYIKEKKQLYIRVISLCLYLFFLWCLELRLVFSNFRLISWNLPFLIHPFLTNVLLFHFPPTYKFSYSILHFFLSTSILSFIIFLSNAFSQFFYFFTQNCILFWVFAILICHKNSSVLILLPATGTPGWNGFLYSSSLLCKCLVGIHQVRYSGSRNERLHTLVT